MSSSSRRPQGFGRYSPETGRGMSLAFEFAGAVFLFWFLGKLVDGWLDTDPWFQVIGALLGWVGGFLHVYYWSKNVTKVRESKRTGA